MAKSRTYKGKVVDFDDIIKGKDKEQAVGNANMNARGDILDEKGRIKQSKEDRARDYNRNVSNSVIKSSLLDEVDEDLPDLSSVTKKKAATQKKTESKPTQNTQTVKESDTKKEDSGDSAPSDDKTDGGEE
jgi:hypothetical protein